MSDQTSSPHEPVPPSTGAQPGASQPDTDSQAPAAPTRAGWRGRRVSLVAAAAALVVGCVLGAGAAAAAVALTGESSHGGDGHERSGRDGDGRHADGRRDSGRDQPSPTAPSATATASPSPSAT